MHTLVAQSYHLILVLVAFAFVGHHASAGKVVFVDADATGQTHDGTSWCDAYQTLYDALDNVVPPATIRVANGTYKPDTNGLGDPREATFQLINNVTVEGGYAGCGAPDPDERDIEANETILSGDLNGDDAPVVCTQDSPDCDGFGSLCGDGGFCIIPGNNGENTYSVVTINIAGMARLDGFCVNQGNGVSNNDGGGITSFASGEVMIANCVFRGNAGWGGALQSHASGGTITVSNCKFVGNRGAFLAGGISHAFTSNDSDIVITNCVLRRNKGESGGGVLVFSSSDNASITNCTFSGNVANSGGGLAVTGLSSATISNCTLVNNAAMQDVGGISIVSLGVTVSNSIVWNNSDSSGTGESAQVGEGASSDTVISYSVIGGGWSGLGGDGNSTANPLFVDAVGFDGIPGTDDDDLRLHSGSPAIDSGDNDAIPMDLADLDGDLDLLEPTPLDLIGANRRVDDCLTDPDKGNGGGLGLPIVDMGAIEFFTDCDNNGQPDTCDIANCDGSSGCLDCNLNGLPDACDILSGQSEDTDMDGVPDECVFWVPPAKPLNDNWSESENWFPGIVPDNVPMGATYSVVIQGPLENVILDIDAEINSLQVRENATLNVSDGDLTIETVAGLLITGGEIKISNDQSVGSDESGITMEPGCDGSVAVGNCPPRLAIGGDGSQIDVEFITLSGGGSIDLADAASINLGATSNAGELRVSNGTYQADPDRVLETSASLETTGALLTNEVTGRALMTLEDSMTVTTSANFTLAISPACQMGGCMPPRLEILDSAEVIVGGNFVVDDGAEVFVGGSSSFTITSGTSPSSVTLSGDFRNRSVTPMTFDWSSGQLTLDGTDQKFEVAGADLGPVSAGMSNNFAVGILSVAPAAEVVFLDDQVNAGKGGDALYVDTLILGSGSTVTLTAGKIYYNTLIDEGATIIVEGGELGEVEVGISAPLPERHFDGNPSPPGGADPSLDHPCVTNTDCENQGSGSDANARCLTGADDVSHCYVAKNRIISIEANPANNSVSHSLRVSWDQGGGVFAPVGFVSATPLSGTNSPAPHPLQPDPDPIDWNAMFPRVHITGCAIVPGATYRVQALPAGADPAEEINYSAPVELYTTAAWGDVTGAPIVTSAASGPDGFANLGDVLDAVLASGGTPSAPSVWFDVEGGGTSAIDNFTNLADALSLLGAITEPYPFGGPGDAGCPLP